MVSMVIDTTIVIWCTLTCKLTREPVVGGKLLALICSASQQGCTCGLESHLNSYLAIDQLGRSPALEAGHYSRFESE